MSESKVEAKNEKDLTQQDIVKLFCDGVDKLLKTKIYRKLLPFL